MPRTTRDALGRGLAILSVLLLIALMAGPGQAVEIGPGKSSPAAPGTDASSPAAGIADGLWTWQNPLPQGNLLSSVFFINNNDTGWAVGHYGTTLKTINGGPTWAAQSSGTTDWLTSVAFVDAQTGWAVGVGGTILWYVPYTNYVFIPLASKSYSAGW